MSIRAERSPPPRQLDLPTSLSLPYLPRSSNGGAQLSRPSHVSNSPPRTTISAYIRAEGPYITYEMIKKMEEKVRDRQESRRKWITPRGFVTAIKQKNRFIENYVQMTPSEVPVLHNYREVHREKWLGGAFRPAKYNHKIL